MDALSRDELRGQTDGPSWPLCFGSRKFSISRYFEGALLNLCIMGTSP